MREPTVRVSPYLLKMPFSPCAKKIHVVRTKSRANHGPQKISLELLLISYNSTGFSSHSISTNGCIDSFQKIMMQLRSFCYNPMLSAWFCPSSRIFPEKYAHQYGSSPYSYGEKLIFIKQPGKKKENQKTRDFMVVSWDGEPQLHPKLSMRSLPWAFRPMNLAGGHCMGRGRQGRIGSDPDVD